jgi:alcohol dehydrogenase (cytochrome c)
VDWPGYNNDPGSNRYAAIAQITKANVGGLHVVCTASLGKVTRFETGPIVVGGILYATTPTQTYAINGATCATVWVNTYVPTKKAGAANRGVAYANGMLFRGFADGHVIAISAANGATVWNQNIVASGSYEYLSGAPVTWGSGVFIGTADGDNGQICHVVGLDQATGTVLWSQQTVPNPGQPEAKKTWKGATHIAGGASWTSLTVDSSTGKLYAPVGNPGPDFDIRLRKGANLNTNSILEFDSASGKLLRTIQLIPNDFHDWDQAAAPALVTLSGGQKLLLSAGKNGMVVGVDLATLDVLWSAADTTISNASAPIVPGGTHFCPGGAVFWNGPSYSPSSGLAYVNAVDWCKTVHLAVKPQPYPSNGSAWLGSSDGYGEHDATSSGWLTAVNVKSGAVSWTYHAATPLLSGVTATAGRLVFSADLKGNVFAFDDSSGALLKTVATGAAVGGGIVSYETAGTQYVAVAAGFVSADWNTPQATSAIVVLGL